MVSAFTEGGPCNDPYLHCTVTPLILWPGLRLQNLRFSIYPGDPVRIKCHDFAGEVAQDQQLGTLVGLKRGLLLRNNHEQKLLLPHAKALRKVSGIHCDVDLDLSNLRKPPLFAYTIRADLRELRGQKNRAAWLYLAQLHALTGHVLRDPFTLRTGTENALCLLRSARCRGNLSNGDDIPCPVAEQTLMEIACLSPVRQPNKKGSAESVNFQDLQGLCAHEGFAFLSRAALSEIQEQKALGGHPSNAASEDIMRQRCSVLSQRSYFRSRDIFGLPGRLESDEEESAGQPKHSWQPTCWNESFGECQQVREVAFVIFTNSLAPPPESMPCLKSLLLTQTSLQGCVDYKCEMLSVANWEVLSASDLRQMWIPFFQAVTREKKEKCGLMLGYFAFRWPRCTAHLQLLGSICVRRKDLVGLHLPIYSSYERPDEKDLNRSTVQQCIRRHLETFSEPFPRKHTRREQELAERAFGQRQQDHERRCEESLKRLETHVRKKWEEGVRALELRDCADGMLGVSSKSPMERIPAPPAFKNSFGLPEPETSFLEEFPLDEHWILGAPKKQYVLEPSESFQPPPRVCPELRLAAKDSYAAIHQELCIPLQESWRLAHEMNMSQISHSYFPETLGDHLRESLERRREDTMNAWHRVREAVSGTGRFDALQRSCGLFEEPVPLSVLPRLLTTEGQLQQACANKLFLYI